MKVTNIYNNKEIAFLTFTSQFKTEEECAIPNYYQENKKEKLNIYNGTYKHGRYDVPYIILSLYPDSCFDYYKEQVFEKLEQKLKYAKKNFDNINTIEKLKEYVFSNYAQEDIIINGKNYTENRVIYDDFTFTIFSGGCENSITLIAANPYTTYLNKDELKSWHHRYEKYTLNMKKKINKSEEIVTVLKERQEEIFNNNVTIFKELEKAKEEKRLLLMGGRSFLSNGLNIISLPYNSNYIVEMYKYPKLMIFDKDEEGYYFIKDDEVIQKDIAELDIYYKEEQKQLKKLELVKEYLSLKKKKYFFLGNPQKNKEGEWIFLLNPYDQDIYNYGWFTLKDLALWGKNKGPIIMKKE